MSPRVSTIHLHPRPMTTTVQVPVSFLLSPAEFQALRRLAHEAKLSRSAFIRRLIGAASRESA